MVKQWFQHPISKAPFGRSDSLLSDALMRVSGLIAGEFAILLALSGESLDCRPICIHVRISRRRIRERMKLEINALRT